MSLKAQNNVVNGLFLVLAQLTLSLQLNGAILEVLRPIDIKMFELFKRQHLGGFVLRL